jgi:hypothetical protein
MAFVDSNFRILLREGKLKWGMLIGKFSSFKRCG